MNAPDKIYLTPLLVEGCGKNLSKRVTENDVVYIRKDALVEWLEQVKADPMIPMNIDKVIEHINSL